jgi:hypothetical protein
LTGKRPDRGVEIFTSLDVAVARDRDPVLRALELRLEREEVLVRLQVRIILGDGDQAAERLRQLALRRLEFLERRRVVQRFRRHLDRGRAGARFGDADEDRLLLRRVALDRVHEVRDQVGAPLVLVDDLGPRGLHRLVLGLDGVVAAARQGEAGHGDEARNQVSHEDHSVSVFVSYFAGYCAGTRLPV